MLPLIIRENPAAFIRIENGARRSGLVFSQHANQHRRNVCHPFMFYVEFPVGGPTYEVSARRLAAVLGSGAANHSFSRADLANALACIPPDMALEKLLPALPGV